jgi:transcriptional antiterminator Rof (Rho-off)
MSNPYKPVSCALYDQLELSAMHKKPVTLTLADGREETIIIAGMETRKNEGEYLITTTGTEIRLDYIVKFNGTELQTMC